MTDWMPEPRFRPLCLLSVEIGAPHRLGPTPEGGERMVVPVIGGRLEGERLSGRILPGAAGDWACLRPDGALALDVRFTVETDDGALIYVTYAGLRHGPEAVIAALAQGERVDPETLYFRVAMRFETAEGRYGWLNRALALGMGERLPEGPRYHVFEVL